MEKGHWECSALHYSWQSYHTSPRCCPENLSHAQIQAGVSSRHLETWTRNVWALKESHGSLGFLSEPHLGTSLLLSKTKVYILRFAYNFWISKKPTAAMSCSSSSPFTVEFREVTPFNNKQICLNNSKILCWKSNFPLATVLVNIGNSKYLIKHFWNFWEYIEMLNGLVLHKGFQQNIFHWVLKESLQVIHLPKFLMWFLTFPKLAP